ncbi:MAG: repressor LexA [Dehalococcoidia bacterium]|nr:repressor LexA [Dehalococcoidia bacterium]
MATKALSSRQKRIITFIHEFLRDKGYPPSIRDIADRCEISSTSVVAYNLDRLEEAGYIRRHSDISRGIELLNKQQDSKGVVYIPIVGRIAAGEPIPVPASDSWNIPSSDGIEVAEELTRGKQVYALRVKGNSMVDALIKDGDIVLMDFVSSIEEGEMAAVWLRREQEVTLKKVFTEPDRIRLEPANTQMKPIYTSSGNVEIQGRVIAVIRAMP